jgi:hypothetical protein
MHVEGPVEGPVVEQAMFVANLYQAKESMGYNRVPEVVLQAVPNHLAAASPLLHQHHVHMVAISLHPHFVPQYPFILIIIRSSSSIGSHIERVQTYKLHQTILGE